MLARELVLLLDQYPDAEVGFLQYTGCDTPFLTVKGVVFLEHSSDARAIIYDGGNFIDRDGFTEKDLILLRVEDDDV